MIGVLTVYCVHFRFVDTYYHDVQPYLDLDPLLRAVFISLTPEAEFPLLCERMPPYLTAAWLTKCILESKRVDKNEVPYNAVVNLVQLRYLYQPAHTYRKPRLH